MQSFKVEELIKCEHRNPRRKRLFLCKEKGKKKEKKKTTEILLIPVVWVLSKRRNESENNKLKPEYHVQWISNSVYIY